jgi:hypothetical protein
MLAYLLVLAACGTLMLMLPPPYSSLIFIALIAFSLIAASDILGIPLFPDDMLARLNTLRRVAPYLIAAAEIVLICAALYAFTPQVRDMREDLRLRGPEYSYLIGSGAVAAQVYHHGGAIPLWNPFMGRGEPMLESPFSYVLNPFMTAPIILYGAVQGGKIALIWHVFIMGAGGWLLAKALDCRAPGRILLGLLLGASGSFAGAIGFGFYQMSLSQAYVPWVYAGLIGTLYRHERAWIVVLACAAALLIFAGTFWYVLPTALGALALTLFALVRRDGEKPRVILRPGALPRLIGASALAAMLSAVRMIPQLAHYDLIDHPFYELLITLDFGDLFRAYFDSSELPELYLYAMYYHYVVPPLFALLMILMRLWVTGSPSIPNRVPRWRIAAPAALLIVFFTAWAQERTPLFLWLYQTFPVLTEWRFLGRMMAAAAIWVAALAALAFDDVLRAYADGLPRPLNLFQLAPRAAAALIVIGAGVYAAVDVMLNWYRAAGTESTFTYTAEALHDLRTGRAGAEVGLTPTSFIPMWTEGFFDYLPHYETLIRGSFGNPDYRPRGLPSTLGGEAVSAFPPEFAAGLNPTYQSYLIELGYRLMPGYSGVTRYGIDAAEGLRDPRAYRVVRSDNPPTYPTALWHHPGLPSYLFAVHEDELIGREQPLTAREALPIRSYEHNVDWIRVTLGDYDPGFVLVAQETAYPGWRVTVDRRAAPIESVGGIIGVRLPEKAPGSPPTIVEFHYDPPLLYLGAVISVAGAVIGALYLLRADRVFTRRRKMSNS